MNSLVFNYVSKCRGNIKNIDIILLLAFISLLVIRIIANYSSQSITNGSLSFTSWTSLIVMATLSFIIIFGFSLLDTKELITISVILFLVMLIALVAVFYFPKINGSARWIRLGYGFGFQPSEFIKPFLIIILSGLFLLYKENGNRVPLYISIAIIATVGGLILFEPDLGQTLQIFIHWFFLLFLTGVPYIIVLGFILLSLLAIFGAYWLFPHVAYRINNFFDDPSQNFQIKKGFNAIANGGIGGKGPGEGASKLFVPEAQSDFIFAALSEEFGLVAALILLFVFGLILLRTYYLLLQHRSYFQILAGSGLIFMLILQMLINLSSVLYIIPTKGLTLPFISSGGSSLFTVSIAAGMILSLTRKNYRREID
ncbi:MAG: FtsW/RodA/SpoVE family cell cycle protein [Candidatus Pacebacteria bacterium]|nr:FtsW/RodA/SpoVE family cell cycle protein [Candidatus Paceibacterota bacterium]